MDRVLFDTLEIPRPAYHLDGVAEKKYHGAQTAAMLVGIERILLEERPGLVIVGGDANTNLAGALAARKLHINVGHIEAGERSYDWRMPEEHNRRMIDHISNLLFATNEKSAKSLRDEKVIGEVFGGNVRRAKEIFHGKGSLIKINSKDNPLFKGLDDEINVMRYHSLIVEKNTMNDEVEVMGETFEGEIMALKHKTYEIYGVQFHPESIFTKEGEAIVKNFVEGICNGNK